MRKTLSPLAALGVVVMVAAAGAGCAGTQGSGTSTAAAAGTTTGSNGTAAHASTVAQTSTLTPREKAVKFAECMRRDGVAAFPDPDAYGALTVDAVANGSSVDTGSAVFERALSRCKGLEPAGFTGHKRTPQQQKAALRFAQCMRDDGVKDFPDPGPDDPLIDTRRIPSSGTPAGMSILHAAMQKCRGSAGEAGVSRP